MAKKRVITIIRKSCLTGQAVWVSHQRSYKAEYYAYQRACQKEIERIQHWGEQAAVRKANILRILNECKANIPSGEELPPEKREAARQLEKMAEMDIPPDRAFYDHIMEERQRGGLTREERRKLRVEKTNNRRYDK